MASPRVTYVSTHDIRVPVLPDVVWPGLPENDPDKPAQPVTYESIYSVLTTEYLTDAHFGCYSCPDVAYRLNLPYVPDHGFVSMVLLTLDVDYAGAHRFSGASGQEPAPDSWFSAELPKIEQLFEAHPGGYGYRTRGGYRTLWAVGQPWFVLNKRTAELWTLRYKAFAASVWRRFGIIPDPSCGPWSQHFRVPGATRVRGQPPERRERLGDPSRLGVLDWEISPQDMAPELHVVLASQDKLWAKHGLHKTKNASKRPQRRRRSAGTRIVEAGTGDPLAVALAPVVAKIDDGRHVLYQELAGALYLRGLPPTRVLDIIHQLCVLAGDEEIEGRLHDGDTTIACIDRRRPVIAEGTLLLDSPDVAEAIVDVLGSEGSPTHRRMENELYGRPVPEQVIGKDEATARIRGAIEEANSGLHLILAPPGTGKTKAAVGALLLHPGKAALVVPRNELARQHELELETARPGQVQRLFGAGQPTPTASCSRPDVVEAFQKSGLGGPSACGLCPDQPSCRVKTGRSGPRTAPIVVGIHALLGTAANAIGEPGLLVIDEGMPLFKHAALSMADLDAARAGLRRGLFAKKYASVMRTIVNAAIRVTSARDRSRPFVGQLFDELPSTPTGHIASLRGPRRDGWRAQLAKVTKAGKTPPFAITRAAEVINTGDAKLLTRASRTLRELGRAVLDEAVVHWSYGTGSRRDDPMIVVSSVRKDVVQILSRSGPSLLLDATADIVPLRSLGLELTVHELEVQDAAPIDRVAIAWNHGSHTKMAPHGRADFELLRQGLSLGLQRLQREGRKNVLVIAFKPVADELRKGLNDLGLGGFVRDGGRVLVTHFGGLRGANNWEEVQWDQIDAVLTIGDPIPNIDNLNAEATLLGLTDEQADDRLRSLAAAELAQAHGRLRATRRETPATSVHVGRIVPGGWDRNNAVVEGTSGRPPTMAAMGTDELVAIIKRVGSVAKVSKATGISRRTLHRYKAGGRIPAHAASKLRALLNEHEPPGQ